jgi:tetratricopeptide (TPR) repeat protein
MIDVTLVTVHGFWSSSATWDRLTSVWSVDGRLHGLHIHSFGYPSPKRPRLPLSPSRVPDHDDIAQTLATEYTVTLADAAAVVFVTHSQGGLILQRFLAWMVQQHRGRELARIASVVMLACPNNGADYLRSLRRALGFGRHPQAARLEVLDKQVADTQRIVLQRIVNADGVDGHQCRIPLHVYAGDSDRVVLAASAQAAYPGAGTLAGTHFSILDPAAPGNRTAEIVRHHLLTDLTARAAKVEKRPRSPRPQRNAADGEVVVHDLPSASGVFVGGDLTELSGLLRDDAGVVVGAGPAAVVEVSGGPATTVIRHARGLRTICDHDPQALGIHPAIGVDERDWRRIDFGGPLPDLPLYVERDTDRQLHAAIRSATERGGLIVLIGDACVGKKRSAYEALRALVPDWPVVVPYDVEDLNRLAIGPDLPEGTIVWLGDLEDVFLGEERVRVGVMRRLLNPNRRLIVVGTIWQTAYNVIVAPPMSDLRSADSLRAGWRNLQKEDDPNRDARDILELLARRVFMSDFSPAERTRADSVIRHDPRIRLALEDREYGVAQFLAGAPALVAHWQRGGDEFGRAIIDAAINLRRLGIRGPLSADLLEAACIHLLSQRARATAPSDWFRTAIAFASTALREATAAISPLAGDAPGEVAGYTVAGYLVQYAERNLQTRPIVASVWEAVLHHCEDSFSVRLAATEAGARFHVRIAERLYLRAIDLGDTTARHTLARTYLEAGREAEAMEQLRTAALEGDVTAAEILGDVHERFEDLGATLAALERQEFSAVVGRKMAAIHAMLGQIDKAVAILQPLASAGDPGATRDLVRILLQEGDHDEAIRVCRAALAIGDLDIRQRLVHILSILGRREQLEAELRAGVEDRDIFACRELARLWQAQERFAEAAELCRVGMSLGDPRAVLMLLKVLAQIGDVQEGHRVVRAGVASGMIAPLHLYTYVMYYSTLDEAIAELARMVEAGVPGVRRSLARLIESTGDVPAAIDAWEKAADAGEPGALREWGSLLATWRHDDAAATVFRSAVAAGDLSACEPLARSLERKHRTSAAIEVLEGAIAAGYRPGLRRLGDLLRRSGRPSAALDQYRHAVESGDRHARDAFLETLTAQRGSAEAARVRREGIPPPVHLNLK